MDEINLSPAFTVPLIAAAIWLIVRLLKKRDQAEARSDPEPWLQPSLKVRSVPDDDDDRYRQFVDEMWASETACPVGVPLERNGENSFVESLVDRRGTIYVNAFEAGERKTYVANRHRWTNDGFKISDAAFRAILCGTPPAVALRFDRPPASVDEALSPDNNHIAADNVLVINYRDAVGEEAYRVVSDIRRGDDRFTARCHWRWGERRTFRYDRLVSIIDPVSRTEIPIEEFRNQRKPMFAGLAKRMRRKKA